MNTSRVIEKLNEAISHEYAGFHFYLQCSLLVHGPDRVKWKDYFEKQSDEGRDHAKIFAQKVVALGGMPTSETASFRQSEDLDEMLELALEHEKKAVRVYSEAHALVEGHDKPLQFLLENQILDEQHDADEMEKFVRREKIASSKKPMVRVA